MCYMDTITHRELRNHSAEVLRRVEAGESLQVTNNGRPAARIVPTGGTVLDDLIARGQARPARSELGALRSIRRAQADRTAAAIIEDTRGQW
jgi:prevent-host-death family protein